MFFKRDKLEIKNGYKGIELTLNEMEEVYDYIKRERDIESMTEWLWERADDKGLGEKYCYDWCRRVAESLANKLEEIIDNHDDYNETYWILSNDLLDETMKEMGHEELVR